MNDLTKSEKELFNTLLNKENVSNKDWEKDFIKKEKANFIAEMMDNQSDTFKTWKKEKIITGKRDFIMLKAKDIINGDENIDK